MPQKILYFTPGVAGNAIALVNNGTKVTRSSPTLTGGVASSGYPTYTP